MPAPTEPLGRASRDFGTNEAAATLPEPVFRDAEGRGTPAAVGPTAGRRFADGVYETVELLAASYVAEGKSIPAAARLAADQLVNNHPGLADELAAEAASGQGGLGDGVVPDVAERSSESAIKRGGEVDGGLPDFDVAETPDGNLEVRRMDGEVRAVSVEELGQLQALADEIIDAGETPSEDLVNDVGDAVRQLLPGVEQRLTDEDAFLVLRLAADPRELEAVTEALTRGETPATILRTAASPVQWLVTVGVPLLLKVLRTFGRKGTKRKRPRQQSEESGQPDLQRRQPMARPEVERDKPETDEDSSGTGRRPWPSEFPDVVVHQPSDSQIRAKKHPDFAAAKAGDDEAGDRFVSALVDHNKLERIAEIVGSRQPIIVPVQAQEAEGRNVIPQVYAEVLEDRFGWPTTTEIVQTNRPRRTGARGIDRFFRRAKFDGPVQPGREYVIVDDNVTIGGTIADLRTYIEGKGGRVILATTLTSARPVVRLNLAPDRLAELREAFGEFEPEWEEFFGFNFEGLTNAEAGFLLRPGSFDAVRDRIAAARIR